MRKLNFLIIMLMAVSHASMANMSLDESQIVNAQIEIINFNQEHNFISAEIILDISPGWYIYYQQPGDAGLPTTFEAGDQYIKRVDIRWPAPNQKRDKVGEQYYTSAIYQGKIIFPANILLSSKDDVEKELTLILKYAACGASCIPESKTLRFRVKDLHR